MPTALHLLSYVAGSGAFLVVLLSFASGLLYLAEVIEEHAAQAKVMGQRIIWLVIALLATMHLVDALPLYIAALGIFCHLVYLQNFSRSWPRISLMSPVFILSCVLVIANHFISLNYFSERARSSGYQPYRHGGRGAHTGSRWSSAHLSHASNQEETFLDVATYFGICVWLCPFFLFLSLSANDNVLPSKGEASIPTSPVQSRPPSPVLSKQSGGTPFLKTLISCLLGFVPQRDRRSKNDHVGRNSTLGGVAHDTKSLLHVRSTPKLESASPVMGSLGTGWNQPPGTSLQGQRSVSGPAAMVGNRERDLHSRSAPGSPQNSPLASRLLGPSFSVNPFTTAFAPRSPPKPSRNEGPLSSDATLAYGPAQLGPCRHTADEGFGFGMAAVGSKGVAPMTQATSMGHSSPPPRRPLLPTSGFTYSSDLSVDTSPRRSSMPGNIPGLIARNNPNRGPPPPAASSGMAFKITPVPVPNPTLPTIGQGSPPRPSHQRTNSLVTLTPTRPTHVRRQSVGAGSLDALTLDLLPSTPSPVRPQHSVTSNAHGVPSVSIGLGRPSTFVSFTS